MARLPKWDSSREASRAYHHAALSEPSQCAPNPHRPTLSCDLRMHLAMIGEWRDGMKTFLHHVESKWRHSNHWFMCAEDGEAMFLNHHPS